MSDLVGTFRSYALDKDNCPRMDTEVVYVRVGLLMEAAARIEQLEEASEMMLTDIRRTDVDMLAFKARIEQLEAALREIATYEIEDGCPCSACQHSALARAALAAPSGAMDVHSIGHMGSL